MSKIFDLEDSISISLFDYPLEEGHIASHPVVPRDSSRLLVFRNRRISDHIFHELPGILPLGSTLYFNDTRVINARILFQKLSGARVEILLLNPVHPPETALIMSSRKKCTWECMIGNLKRWKSEPLELKVEKALTQNSKTLKATLIDRQRQWVEFSWDSADSFAEILSHAGVIPLPPYLKRKTAERDKEDYQTIYSSISGAVAAPTAGLHFTEEVLEALRKKNVNTRFLTLHVSAGTFKPVEVENIKEHPIHQEEIIISKANLDNLLTDKKIIAIGTTSMRTLESIYWLGVQLGNSTQSEVVRKKTPYTLRPIPLKDSIAHLQNYLKVTNQNEMVTRTELFIYPGYKFQICSGLLTNFHLPKSSLLMLVAAFIGKDWKKVYKHALNKDYRFLSYGDASLLLQDGK